MAHMQTRAILFLLLSVASCGCQQTASDLPHDLLITGRGISPATQPTQDVGSMPMNLALSPDGRFIVTTGMGYYESLWSIRTSDGKGVSHVDYPNRASAIGGEANPPTTRHVDESNGLYYGLAIAPDNTVYAAQGAHDTIAVLQLGEDGKLEQRG